MLHKLYKLYIIQTHMTIPLELYKTARTTFALYQKASLDSSLTEFFGCILLCYLILRILKYVFRVTILHELTHAQ